MNHIDVMITPSKPTNLHDNNDKVGEKDILNTTSYNYKHKQQSTLQYENNKSSRIIQHYPKPVHL